MENSELYNEWIIGLILVSVIIVIAAVLLIMIWLAAKRILRLAGSALELVITIKNNTNSIWDLQTTNSVAVDIQNETKAIETHAGMVATALEELG